MVVALLDFRQIAGASSCMGSARLRPMRRIPWKLLGAGGLTAVLLDFPFPLAGPLPAWRAVFAWFALVPLLVGLLRLPLLWPERGIRWTLAWSFAAGWLTGALWFGANCYWVYNTMHTYGNMGAGMAAVCLLLFSLFLGFWFGVFALAMGLVRRATFGRKSAWLGFVAIPVLWTAMEFALARIPEFPWDQLGYSQIDNPLLMAMVPWTGVCGVSFVISAINAISALLIICAKKRGRFPTNQPLSSIGALLILWIVLPLTSHSFVDIDSPKTTATALLIQPNLDVIADDVWVGTEWDRQIAQFQRLGSRACGSFAAGMPETNAAGGEVKCEMKAAVPDLIVWPESPAPFRGLDPKFQAAMAGIVQADKAPMIVGNIGMNLDAAQNYQWYNSASVLAVDGQFVGRYDKMHLVPFGEYVPFRRLLFFAHQLTQGLSDLGVGKERETFRIGGHRYGVFICYESVFGDEVRQFARLGAEVLVNISDDGWYGDTSAPWQHLNMARMRAIENRRWILRATNNGATVAIDPYGVVRQSIPRHQVGALAAQYGFNAEITFYTEHGDWMAGLCAILGLGLCVWSFRTLLGQMASKSRVKTSFGTM